MKRAAAIVLLVCAMPGSGLAKDQGGALAPEIQFHELVAQYTRSYRAAQISNAIRMAEQALAIGEQVYGPNHEQVAQVLNDLGRFHHVQREFPQAEALHRRALAIRDQVFGADGPAVVQSLNNLGEAYEAQGRFADAEPLYERSLALVERHVPPTDPLIVVELEQYASCLRKGGKADHAAAVEARLKGLRSGK